MHDPPTARQERAARAWRDAKSAAAAWASFRRWLARTKPDDDTGDAPYWCDGVHSFHESWAGPRANGLLLFEKSHVLKSFLAGQGNAERAMRWGIAAAVVPFGPSPLDQRLLRAQSRLLGGLLGFVGDLDPHAVHVFGALRSGNLDAPDIAGRKLVVDWLGIDDAWLRQVRKEPKPMMTRMIRMGWVEREYWEIIKRFAPSLRTLLGDESFELLESGCKVECEGFLDVMPDMLRRRLRGRVRRPARA